MHQVLGVLCLGSLVFGRIQYSDNDQYSTYCMVAYNHPTAYMNICMGVYKRSR